ncbi:S24 family peptidase [Pseudomonas aeruginosa]|nr:S24 family peptidase [Pseudomonas aeruginosa]
MAISGQQIARLLSDKLRELDWSEGELGRRAGVPQPTAHRILAGDTKNPRIDNVMKLAKAMGLDGAELLAGKLVPEFDNNVTEGPAIKGRVPRISWVQAGTLSEAIDLFEPGYAEEWLDCPFPHSSNAFCLEIRGTSMFPEYRPGELILVEPQLEALHDDDVVARTPDGQATFKRLQISEDGTFLLALNPDFPNRVIHVPEDTTICGVVTGSWMNRRRRRTALND